MASKTVESIRAALAARLRDVVAKSGESQGVLAERLKMHQTGVSAALRGKCSIEKLIDVLEQLGEPVGVK